MKIYALAMAAALWSAAGAWAQDRDPPRDRAAVGVEVLTQGPVHEAFAEIISFDPEPGLIAPQAPPDAIEEVPPEQRPEGTNVAWISGYWAWDDDRNDFLWVSGIWRALPPGRQWVSGYWGTAGRGAQWTSGYWADAQATEIDYLPEPPATVEAGPNIIAPSPDHTWVPGNWVWLQNRYAWRPGCWVVGQSDWGWVPAHYVWTPRGYVYVGGYYDYSVARRGVLFAPVYFNAAIYARRGYVYSPTIVVNPAVFVSHLFLRPSYGHYYFGDYYGGNYATVGFSPWFSFYSSRSGYDPFYAQQHWHHRSDREWGSTVQAEYAHRRDHEEARPARTWTAQRERSMRDATSSEKSFVVAASYDDVVKNKQSPIRFQPVAKEEREQFGQRGQEFRTAREERQKLEADGADPTPAGSVQTFKPAKVKLPKTPIVSQPVERLGKGEAPPTAIEVTQPDPKIEPKPRKPRDNPRVPRTDPQVDPKPAPTVGNPRDPKPFPKVEPRPDRPKIDPMAPKVEPKPDRPKPFPKVEPRPDRPKIEPMAPKIEPKPDRPKIEPMAPKVEPKPDRPKIEPMAPKVEPKPDRPKLPPMTPKVEPQPERPMTPPGGERPKSGKGGSKGASEGKGKDKDKDKDKDKEKPKQ